MHAVLIENPIAGSVTRESLRVTERALEATFDLELVSTAARGHAAELAREAVEAGAKTVIAYGGDGTANEVVNGLLGAERSSDVVLAVLPGGGTNVLARSLGYPNDLVGATARLIDLVERGSPRRIALGLLDGEGPDVSLRRYFTFGAGLVFDGETVRRVNASSLRKRFGDGAFVYHALRTYFSIRRSDGPTLTVATPDGDVQAWWASIGNADPFTYLGKRPFRLVPGVKPDRGGLDLVAGRHVRFFGTMRWLTSVLTTAKHVRHPEILHLVDQDVIRITAASPAATQADGEYLGALSTLTAESIPSALPVWA
jgi:diacylglycerol kinase family enzyme